MYNDTFSSLAVGECRSTHVQPLSTDMHLFGVECRESWWLLGVVLFTGFIKLFQKWIYTNIGQLQRELLQTEVELRTWTSQKILNLLFWEFVAGVIGICSILVITGNNVIIWVAIIVFNCIGVGVAYTRVEADHHSTALELINMLKTYDGTGCEHDKTMEAICLLRQVLDHHRQYFPIKKQLVFHMVQVNGKPPSKPSAPPMGTAVPIVPNPDDMLRQRNTLKL